MSDSSSFLKNLDEKLLTLIITATNSTVNQCGCPLAVTAIPILIVALENDHSRCPKHNPLHYLPQSPISLLQSFKSANMFGLNDLKCTNTMFNNHTLPTNWIIQTPLVLCPDNTRGVVCQLLSTIQTSKQGDPSRSPLTKSRQTQSPSKPHSEIPVFNSPSTHPLPSSPVIAPQTALRATAQAGRRPYAHTRYVSRFNRDSATQKTEPTQKPEPSKEIIPTTAPQGSPELLSVQSSQEESESSFIPYTAPTVAQVDQNLSTAPFTMLQLTLDLQVYRDLPPTLARPPHFPIGYTHTIDSLRQSASFIQPPPWITNYVLLNQTLNQTQLRSISNSPMFLEGSLSYSPKNPVSFLTPQNKPGITVSPNTNRVNRLQATPLVNVAGPSSLSSLDFTSASLQKAPTSRSKHTTSVATRNDLYVSVHHHSFVTMLEQFTNSNHSRTSTHSPIYPTRNLNSTSLQQLFSQPFSVAMHVVGSDGVLLSGSSDYIYCSSSHPQQADPSLMTIQSLLSVMIQSLSHINCHVSLPANSLTTPSIHLLFTYHQTPQPSSYPSSPTITSSSLSPSSSLPQPFAHSFFFLHASDTLLRLNGPYELLIYPGPPPTSNQTSIGNPCITCQYPSSKKPMRRPIRFDLTEQSQTHVFSQQEQPQMESTATKDISPFSFHTSSNGRNAFSTVFQHFGSFHQPFSDYTTIVSKNIHLTRMKSFDIDSTGDHSQSPLESTITSKSQRTVLIPSYLTQHQLSQSQLPLTDIFLPIFFHTATSDLLSSEILSHFLYDDSQFLPDTLDASDISLAQSSCDTIIQQLEFLCANRSSQSLRPQMIAFSSPLLSRVILFLDQCDRLQEFINFDSQLSAVPHISDLLADLERLHLLLFKLICLLLIYLSDISPTPMQVTLLQSFSNMLPPGIVMEIMVLTTNTDISSDSLPDLADFFVPAAATLASLALFYLSSKSNIGDGQKESQFQRIVDTVANHSFYSQNSLFNTTSPDSMPSLYSRWQHTTVRLLHTFSRILSTTWIREESHGMDLFKSIIRGIQTLFVTAESLLGNDDSFKIFLSEIIYQCSKAPALHFDVCQLLMLIFQTGELTSVSLVLQSALIPSTCYFLLKLFDYHGITGLQHFSVQQILLSMYTFILPTLFLNREKFSSSPQFFSLVGGWMFSVITRLLHFSVNSASIVPLPTIITTSAFFAVVSQNACRVMSMILAPFTPTFGHALSTFTTLFRTLTILCRELKTNLHCTASFSSRCIKGILDTTLQIAPNLTEFYRHADQCQSLWIDILVFALQLLKGYHNQLIQVNPPGKQSPINGKPHDSHKCTIHQPENDPQIQQQTLRLIRAVLYNTGTTTQLPANSLIPSLLSLLSAKGGQSQNHRVEECLLLCFLTEYRHTGRCTNSERSIFSILSFLISHDMEQAADALSQLLSSLFGEVHSLLSRITDANDGAQQKKVNLVTQQHKRSSSHRWAKNTRSSQYRKKHTRHNTIRQRDSSALHGTQDVQKKRRKALLNVGQSTDRRDENRPTSLDRKDDADDAGVDGGDDQLYDEQKTLTRSSTMNTISGGDWDGNDDELESIFDEGSPAPSNESGNFEEIPATEPVSDHSNTIVEDDQGGEWEQYEEETRASDQRTARPSTWSRDRTDSSITREDTSQQTPQLLHRDSVASSTTGLSDFTPSSMDSLMSDEDQQDDDVEEDEENELESLSSSVDSDYETNRKVASTILHMNAQGMPPFSLIQESGFISICTQLSHNLTTMSSALRSLHHTADSQSTFDQTIDDLFFVADYCLRLNDPRCVPYITTAAVLSHQNKLKKETAFILLKRMELIERFGVWEAVTNSTHLQSDLSARSLSELSSIDEHDTLSSTADLLTEPDNLSHSEILQAYPSNAIVLSTFLGNLLNKDILIPPSILSSQSLNLSMGDSQQQTDASLKAVMSFLNGNPLPALTTPIPPGHLIVMIAFVVDAFVTADCLERALALTQRALTLMATIQSHPLVSMSFFYSQATSITKLLSTQMFIPQFYFYLRFQGSDFPPNLQQARFVYRSDSYDTLYSFTFKVRMLYPKATIILPGDNLPPTNSKRFIQVFPCWRASDYLSCTQLCDETGKYTPPQIELSEMPNTSTFTETTQFYFYDRCLKDEGQSSQQKIMDIILTMTPKRIGDETVIPPDLPLNRTLITVDSGMPGMKRRARVIDEYPILTPCDEANADFFALVLQRLMCGLKMCETHYQAFTETKNLLAQPQLTKKKGKDQKSEKHPPASPSSQTTPQTPLSTTASQHFEFPLIWVHPPVERGKLDAVAMLISLIEEALTPETSEDGLLGCLRVQHLFFQQAQRYDAIKSNIKGKVTRQFTLDNAEREKKGLPKLDKPPPPPPPPQTGYRWRELCVIVATLDTVLNQALEQLDLVPEQSTSVAMSKRSSTRKNFEFITLSILKKSYENLFLYGEELKTAMFHSVK
ncbi:hypothetical protein BLNAU_6565 [Blattamonas nauphoetae]|uniref:Uncharacterized protein n=1 Tax=Blattamonas nauphoetae TaxID=2049346 RepID=A0ABQ9Y491_9EUKA|nr:hypothetical protein BLNAU_6565 [Blattamonas nauphoetae]